MAPSPLKVLLHIPYILLACIRTLLDIFLFILSLKIRSFYSIFFRCLLVNRPIPPKALPNIPLFQPTIWTSNTPLGEIDMLGHKSNSTYLTDFDAARNFHMCSLFRVGLRYWSNNGKSFINPKSQKVGTDAPFYPALGAVTCTFKKEIRPRQRYDIVTKILSWDDKWLYLISHFVTKGTLKPVHFSDQPRKNRHLNEDEVELPHTRNSAKPVVLAVLVARVIFKTGRQTILPAEFLRDCGLLYPREKELPLTDEEQQYEDAVEERRLKGLDFAEKINHFDQGAAFFDQNEQTVYAKF